jgi:hypothetical protein
MEVRSLFLCAGTLLVDLLLSCQIESIGDCGGDVRATLRHRLLVTVAASIAVAVEAIVVDLLRLAPLGVGGGMGRAFLGSPLGAD